MNFVQPVLVWFCAVVAVIVSAGYAHAQASLSLEVTPAIVEERVDPGQTFAFTISVKNVSETERMLYLFTEDIKGAQADGTPIFADEGEVTEYDMSTWVKLPFESVTIPAGETRSIPYEVIVPASASPGAHFAGVFFDARPPRQRQTGSAIGAQVGSIISLRVAGDAIEDAQLREFSTDKMIYGEPQVTFISRVENMGNVLVRPQGVLVVSDMFGREVANMDINEALSGVFPRSERTFETVWNYDGFAFGRYQAVGSLVYGDDARRTISGTTSFWVLPVKTMLLVLGSILTVILFLYIFARLYIRRKMRELGLSARRADTRYYSKRYGASSSLMLVFSILFLFSMLCLIVLFVMFS